MRRVALIALGIVLMTVARVSSPAQTTPQKPVARVSSPAPPAAQTTTAPAGQTTATQPAAAPVEPPEQPGRYIGVASCANSGCHGSTVPLNAQRIRQNEYYTWLHSDRHAGAYNVLFNNVSARIAKNMRLKNKPYQEKICLDCHSTNVPAASVSGHIDPEDGVQCEACHGPASGWRAEHVQAGWTHQQSVQRGMIDMHDIRTRGMLCDTCHVGSAAKEVDHELIASGHPILAFELDNYTETMPPHWNPNDTHGVRAWAVGQAVAFHDSLDNLSRHARGSKWPEFSDMSCYNCHHSLRTSTWRQERGWDQRAGLPSWSEQRWAVLRLILEKASPSTRAQLDPLVDTIQAKVGLMNDPSGVAAAADQASSIAERAIKTVEQRSWSDADIRSMMTALASDSSFLLRSDVHSAEQTALSLQSLASVLTRRDSKAAASPLMKSIDDLFTEIKDRDEYDPRRFADKLAAVRAAI